MIRRRHEQRFILITQHDHALLAGQLAAHYGNAFFSRPEPLEATIDAVSLHDCGWPLHDDQPMRNAEGLPLDVFESPLQLALRVWAGATDCSADRDPYTRLLVSLHVLGLSAIPQGRALLPEEQFAINQFQHGQIELQEELRRGLDMTSDMPLKLGLAVRSGNRLEDQLRRNHLILQTMDRISLALCCENPPFGEIDQIAPRPGLPPVTLKFTRTDPWGLRVEPWPFAEPALSFELPARRLPARAYASDQELRQVYAESPVDQLCVTLRAP